MKNNLSHAQRLSVMFVYCVITLSIFKLVASAIEPYFVYGCTYKTGEFTPLILIIFIIPMIIMVKKIGLSFKEMGFHLDNWRSNIIVSIISSILFCGVITLILWFLVDDVTMFKPIGLLKCYQGASDLSIILVPLIYIIFVFLQVLLVHGILQSTFITLLDIKYKGILTVIIIVLLFSNFHLDLGIAYGLIVIPPGIFWSTLFLKQRSLLSVYISHCIIGVWALFVLSYVDLIKVFQDFLEFYKP